MCCRRAQKEAGAITDPWLRIMLNMLKCGAKSHERVRRTRADSKDLCGQEVLDNPAGGDAGYGRQRIYGTEPRQEAPERQPAGDVQA